MKRKILILLVLTAIAGSLQNCQNRTSENPSAVNYDEIWQDPAQDIDTRVADLISKMTLEEKVSQMVNWSAEIDRLDIPAYDWWSECLHGVARFGKATVFPQAVGLAATWDPDLIHRIGTAISDEGRAMFHAAEAMGISRRYGGLTYWTPNVNIFRDPRWGRGQETYGEDPYLTAQIGVSLVKGIQGDHPRYLKAGACGKHYVVHSGPEALRHEFNAIASEKDMRETYMYAFRELVDAGVEAIMCAYNRTNGEACCGSDYLLLDVLRDEWGFDGHILSDCWALKDFYEGHGLSEGRVDAAALALKSGVNMNCGDTYPYLVDAVEQGLITEAEIDESFTYLLRTRFKLGLFDPPEMVPYTSISTDVINCQAHKDLAREAARKCVVLLKNEDNILPLKSDTSKIFIIGPNASNLDVMLGNYYGLSDDMSTILEGIVGKMKPGTFVEYRMGALLERDNINPMNYATGGAKRSSITIAVMGISPLLEGEEGESLLSPTKGDRLDIRLPRSQVRYLETLREGNEKPIVLVLTGGSPIDISEVEHLVDAIVFVWYPGEAGGDAVADILFGDVNPSGRLPITFPKSIEDLPPYDDYSMKGRTYRYMTKDPLYPFGYGLSYTQFSYEPAIPSAEINAGESFELEVTVRNTGSLAGEDVVQLYVSALDLEDAPIAALKGFQRVYLEPGESRQLSFSITEKDLQVVNAEGQFVLEPGTYQLTVGGASPGNRSRELGISPPAETLLSVR